MKSIFAANDLLDKYVFRLNAHVFFSTMAQEIADGISAVTLYTDAGRYNIYHKAENLIIEGDSWSIDPRFDGAFTDQERDNVKYFIYEIGHNIELNINLVEDNNYFLPGKITDIEVFISELNLNAAYKITIDGRILFIYENGDQMSVSNDALHIKEIILFHKLEKL